MKSWLHIVIAFLGGILVSNLATFLLSSTKSAGDTSSNQDDNNVHQQGEDISEAILESPSQTQQDRQLRDDGACGPNYGDVKCSCIGDDQFCSLFGNCGWTDEFKTTYHGFDGKYDCDDPVLKEEINGDRCWTGSAAAVSKICGDYNASCCSGTDACTSWSGENTVCAGSCTDTESCKGIGKDNRILAGSCTGVESCKSLGGNNHVLAGTCTADHGCESLSNTVVQDLNCISAQSVTAMELINGVRCFTGSASAVTSTCAYFGGVCCNSTNSWTNWQADNTVCVGACNEIDSCRDFGQNNKILTGACNKDTECQFLARDTTVKQIEGARCYKGTPADVTSACSRIAGSNCCQGDDACFQWKGDSATICVGACHGLQSCAGFGYNTQILQGACKSRWACVAIGEETVGKRLKQVGANSCQGRCACQDVGLQGAHGMGTAYDIFIGANSCNGENSCWQFGQWARMVSVAENSCHGKEACREDYPVLCGHDDMACIDELGSCHGDGSYKEWIASGSNCRLLNATHHKHRLFNSSCYRK